MMSLPERITNKIDRSEECWRWLASHTGAGRPQVWLDGKNRLVYRLMYTTMIGDIPEGMTLDHLCRNGWCCNPYHCEPVSNSVNVSRGLAVRWAGLDSCPKGHSYAEYRRFRKTGKYAGNPYCVACGSERSRDWYRKKAAEARSIDAHQ